MNFEPFETRLTYLLKQWIDEGDHIITGDLYASIRFVIYENNDNLKIELVAEDYLKYLDKGMFIDRFYNDRDVDNIISDLVSAFVLYKLENIRYDN